MALCSPVRASDRHAKSSVKSYLIHPWLDISKCWPTHPMPDRQSLWHILWSAIMALHRTWSQKDRGWTDISSANSAVSQATSVVREPFRISWKNMTSRESVVLIREHLPRSCVTREPWMAWSRPTRITIWMRSYQDLRHIPQVMWYPRSHVLHQRFCRVTASGWHF